MELLLTASLVAAFVAGLAALFAPCCITVLLPAYFASVFRERYKVFLMTFIFFLGVLAVFLPIGLGAAALGKFFSAYHNSIFSVGGLFMIFLGFFLVTGKHFSLPFRVSPSFKKHNAGSVFGLGIFSGIATTCCAPVLAGVLALSFLPGSFLWGGIYTLSYVLGMVAPLFLFSLFLDKAGFMQRLHQVSQKPVRYSLGPKDFSITVAEAVSGATFLIMGALIVYLAFTNQLFSHSSYQIDVNIFLTKILDAINKVVKVLPEYVWAALILSVFGLIIGFSIKQFKKENECK